MINSSVAIIFPNNKKAFGLLANEVAAVTPPAQASLLASFLRNHGVRVVLLDMAQTDTLPDSVGIWVAQQNPDMLVICTDFINSGDVTKMAAAADTARAIKLCAPQIPIVMEGVVPTAYPERVLIRESSDFVCRGEPFYPILELLKKLPDIRAGRNNSLTIPGIAWMKEGSLIDGGIAAPFTNMDEFPAAAYDLVPPAFYRAHHWHCFDCLDRRAPYAAIFTTLGCPYNCSFCSVGVVTEGPCFRTRPTERIMEEIDVLVKRYGVRNIRILDNVFTAREDHVDRLCSAIIARGYDLNIWAYARIESIRNPQMLAKMKKAGIRWLAYGIETANERVKKAISKNTSSAKVDRVIEWTKSAGIWMVGNIIFGLPEDDLQSMQESYNLAVHYDFEWANFYCAVAYPGTPLHDQMRRDGIELPDEWSAYAQYSPNFSPLSTQYVDSKEIVRFRDDAFIRYYTNPAYLAGIEKKFGSAATAFVRKILAYGTLRK